MIAAQIENSVVVNLVEVSTLHALPGLIAGAGARIGDTWTGSAFVSLSAPVAVVPVSVPMRNARLALYSAGRLKQVEDYIAAMEGVEGDLARIDWATALTVRRDSPIVAKLMTLLSLTGDQIDALFISAAALA